MRNLAAGLGLRFLGFHLADQTQNVRSLLNRVIEFEDDLRHKAHSQALSQLVAQKASRMVERFDRALFFLGLAHHADKDLSVAQVAAHLNMGDTGEPDTWIFDATVQQSAYLIADLLAQHFLLL